MYGYDPSNLFKHVRAALRMQVSPPKVSKSVEVQVTVGEVNTIARVNDRYVVVGQNGIATRHDGAFVEDDVADFARRVVLWHRKGSPPWNDWLDNECRLFG